MWFGGCEVVVFVVVDGVELVGVDEFVDGEVVGALCFEGLEVGFGEDVVLVVVDFEAADDLVPGDFFVFLFAPVFVFDGGVVWGVEEVEADAVVFDGGVEFDGDVDHAEGDGAAPNWAHEEAYGLSEILKMIEK